MILGPIFRVELVSAARRRRYFLLRVLFAALILLVLWSTYASTTAMYSSMYEGARRMSISEMASVATAFFMAFTWMQLFGLLAVAPAMAVGTIATEREQRTIEYLFATDLSNLEIVVGKTFARLMLIGQLVLVSLPILFLFRMLGGIPADLLAASFLIAGSTALIVTAMSVCVSVWSKRSRDAVIRVYALLWALLIVPSMVAGAIGFAYAGAPWWEDWVRPAFDFLIALNPTVVLAKSMSSIFAAGAGFDFSPVLHMAFWHLVISVALVALATAAVRRVHLREVSRGSAEKPQRGLRRALLPRWRPKLGDRPVLWKEAFAATAKTKLGVVGFLASAAIFLTALGAVGIAFYFALLENYDTIFTSGNDYFEFLAVFTGMVGGGLLLLLAARSSSLITLEKERDCWVSLLSTPLTGGEIITGKLLGNLYAVRWGFVVLLLAWTLGLAFDWQYIAVIALLVLTFFLCASFISVLGLFFSLRSPTSLRAMGLTLLTTLFLGGGYGMCCCPLAWAGAGDESMAIGFAPCLPYLLVAPAIGYIDIDEGEFVAAYCLGMIGYSIALFALLQYLSSQFDVLSGRTGDMPGASDAE